jgi:bifunctional DNA-binding transcriptional regulator/antitoxin component of YhaV-PrlF toxin-antitoxin module
MERQTDTYIDENGQVYIPASIRKQLNIHKERADVRISLEVLDTNE